MWEILKWFQLCFMYLFKTTMWIIFLWAQNVFWTTKNCIFWLNTAHRFSHDSMHQYHIHARTWRIDSNYPKIVWLSHLEPKKPGEELNGVKIIARCNNASWWLHSFTTGSHLTLMPCILYQSKSFYHVEPDRQTDRQTDRHHWKQLNETINIDHSPGKHEQSPAV